TEFRAADLRFTREESTAFFAGEADGRLSDDQIAALSQRTEGWIAGMRLAATSLRGRQDVVTFVRDFSGSNRYILDYLSEEVMRGLAPADRSFLVRTSVLDRFCAPVCDLLTDDADSQTILERMESANIFIEPLDDTREWYRYHPLFADMLRSRLARLPADEVAELHRRASGWFEARGMRGEATAHALKAGDFGRAADLALAGAEDALMHCDSAALLRWTDALPATERAKRPLLCVYRACAMLQQGKPRTDVEACLAEIESSSAETGLGPELAGLRSRLAYLSGDPETSLALARRAMDALEPGRTFLRHTLSGIMDILSQEVGDPQAVSARHGAGPAITGGRGPASGPGFDHAHGPPPHPVEVLSGREIAIVRLLAEGLTNKEIAERAFVSEETVKWHASNIYGKLGVRNRTEAVARARALGILAGT
ncbi:MAG TPA: LuxR C-terminal-related transcriptional regulator, partial [Spirochaetia bacterium]